MAERANSPEYAKIRASVLKRDSNRCQWPGCKRKRKLEVHHILKFSTHHHLRNEEKNLITLCHKCHNKLKNKEEQFGPILIEIVKQKYK